MKVTNNYPVQPEQLKAAKEILHKYGNTNFKELLEKALENEKPIIMQALEDLKDTDKKNSYYEWVGMINDGSDYKPRMDLIQSLALPLERRCKVCGKVIGSGEYCEECAKQMARKGYGL